MKFKPGMGIAAGMIVLTVGGIVRAQTPVFSLWVTEVNGQPCASCPTRNLPENEVLPGDVIRLDAFVEDWDDNGELGACTGSPNHGFGDPCNIESAGGCGGMHCFGSNGLPCQSGATCFPIPTCVPSACARAPQAAAFQWTLDAIGLTSGMRGNLGPPTIDCDPGDCTNITDGACPCAHFHRFASECTCVFNGSCQANGTCGPSATAFIEPMRSDFLFFNQQAFLTVNSAAPDTQFLGALTGFDAAVVDGGQRYYLGTLLLEASDDAAGTFTVAMRGSNNLTFLNDRAANSMWPQTLLSAKINVPRCAFVSCEDFDDCTVDTMDPVTCACGHQAVSCPMGERCTGGICVAAPLCPDILGSEPPGCGIDARRPHPRVGMAVTEGIDHVTVQFDSACDATLLVLADFTLQGFGGSPGATPGVVSLTPQGDAVELVLDQPLPIDRWWCVTYEPEPVSVCFAAIPGDVNEDRNVGTGDAAALRTWLAGIPSILPPVERTDLNRSLTTNSEDLLELMDLVNGAGAFVSRLGAGIAIPCPVP